MEGFDLVFSLQDIKRQQKIKTLEEKEEFDQQQEQKLEIDETFYFSGKQFHKAIQKGVYELDEQTFQIYSKQLLHVKQVQGRDIIEFSPEDQTDFLETFIDKMQIEEVELKFKAVETLALCFKNYLPGIYCPQVRKDVLYDIEKNKISND